MAILDKKAATPAAANHLRRLLRAIMKLAKRRKMIKTNPMIEIEPIRYKAKGQGNRVKGSCGNQADEELVVPGCDFTL